MRKHSSPHPLPFFYIGKDTTAERIKSYTTHKHELLSNAISKQDTKNIWYSKEHITKLLEEIENAGGDGIRVYFGTYESTHEYAGQTCLLMNATREYRKGDLIFHKDVILENEPDFAERSVLPREMILFSGTDFLNQTNRDFNYGSPCPPRCDDPTEP